MVNRNNKSIVVHFPVQFHVYGKIICLLKKRYHDYGIALPTVTAIFILSIHYSTTLQHLIFMQKNFSPEKLGQWVTNFTDNATLPFITTSAIIELAELEAFIAAIKKQKATCVRIYFLRFSPEDAPTDKKEIKGKLAVGCKFRLASPALTQATIALVPAKNFKHDENYICSADDIITNEGMLTLYPGTIAVGTNLNPPSGHSVALDTQP